MSGIAKRVICLTLFLVSAGIPVPALLGYSAKCRVVVSKWLNGFMVLKSP
ncbi:MAG: hypothetical protein AAGU10_15790 [Methanosarcina mazei]